MRVFVRNSYDPPAVPRSDVAVFFDVFRASTTLLALVQEQPARIVATNSPTLAAAVVGRGGALVSEVFAGGLDNSPTQVRAAGLRGREVVHKSTNFTTALFHNFGGCGRAVVGALVNVDALVAWLRASGAGTVDLVAAAHFARRAEAVEDLAAAELVACRLTGRPDPAWREGVAAYLAGKRQRRPDLAAHYWEDAALAQTLNAIPVLAEVVRRADDHGEVVPL